MDRRSFLRRLALGGALALVAPKLLRTQPEKSRDEVALTIEPVRPVSKVPTIPAGAVATATAWGTTYYDTYTTPYGSRLTVQRPAYETSAGRSWAMGAFTVCMRCYRPFDERVYNSAFCGRCSGLALEKTTT